MASASWRVAACVFCLLSRDCGTASASKPQAPCLKSLAASGTLRSSPTYSLSLLPALVGRLDPREARALSPPQTSSHPSPLRSSPPSPRFQPPPPPPSPGSTPPRGPPLSAPWVQPPFHPLRRPPLPLPSRPLPSRTGWVDPGSAPRPPRSGSRRLRPRLRSAPSERVARVSGSGLFLRALGRRRGRFRTSICPSVQRDCSDPQSRDGAGYAAVPAVALPLRALDTR